MLASRVLRMGGKRTTGLVGLKVTPDARTQCIGWYKKTLEKVKDLHPQVSGEAAGWAPGKEAGELTRGALVWVGSESARKNNKAQKPDFGKQQRQDLIVGAGLCATGVILSFLILKRS